MENLSDRAAEFLVARGAGWFWTELHPGRAVQLQLAEVAA